MFKRYRTKLRQNKSLISKQSSDIRGNTATTSGGLGSSSAYGSTNSGPHSSNVANKADPRVDSDNDRLRGPDSARDHYGVSCEHTTNYETDGIRI